MRTAVVLFTRDLRVHDCPALATAAREADEVVPLFVLDEQILGGEFARPNRLAFLRASLADLDRSLRRRGARLILRRGDAVVETLHAAAAVAATMVVCSSDVSAYAQLRRRRLQRACRQQGLELRMVDGVTVVPPGAVRPSTGSHFSVFTPYYRRWRQAPQRAVEGAPHELSVPATVDHGHLPTLGRPAGGPASSELLDGGPASSELPDGGETAGRERLSAWLRSGLDRYERLHDDLAADATSRLSAYLHFGCLSALEVAQRAGRAESGEPFVRQLCWRDFFHQLLAARPETASKDLHDRGNRWRDDADALDAWRQGQTGYPIVDAGMRQLRREGFLHNRARLITGSFLTKHLYLDWRLGARHYFDLLVDGDLASNIGNWQWVAGTGADTRFNRVLNPIAQARRFDPDGDYVRRYVPELADLDAVEIHEPWKLGALRLRALGYPLPLIDHAQAAAEFRRRRSG